MAFRVNFKAYLGDKGRKCGKKMENWGDTIYGWSLIVILCRLKTNTGVLNTYRAVRRSGFSELILT